ncbi:MAG: hypothetical protein QW397_04315 [Fervidicoccaceae archaeon]
MERRKTKVLDRELEDRELEKIVEVGRRHRQLGLYLYLLERREASLPELHAVYNLFSRHRVTLETVKTQLRFLIGKGLVKEEGGVYRPVGVPLEAALDLFSFGRSRAGRIGAEKTLLKYLYRREGVELPNIQDVSPKLRKKLSKVLEVVRELVERGDKYTALDLIAHTLLPVRATGVLWCWFGDTFLYYEPKPTERGIIHSIRVPDLSKLLKELGFEEGILAYHTLGSSRRWLKKIFGVEDTYPYSRSLFYSLKKLGLAGEGPQYLVELQYLSNKLVFIVKDLYGNTLQVFEREWTSPPPPPLEKEGDKRVSITYGKQHVYAPNEGSYFSRF